MSDFLVNLALRAAGIPPVASLEVAAPWNEPPGFTHITADLEEVEQERPAPKPITSPREDRGFYEIPQALSQERMDVAPLARDPLAKDSEAKPATAPAIPLDSSVPERIREIPAERREIVRDASTVTQIEVRETVREREIVREKVVEREARVEAPHPKEKTIEVHPAIKPLVAQKPDSEPALRDRIREVVVEKPPQFQPPAPRPAPQTPISPPASKSETGREPAREAAPEEGRSDSSRPREIAAHAAPLGKQAGPAPHATPTLKSETADAEPRVSTTLQPAPRPAPAPESPVADTFDAPKSRKQERSVEVKIGSIEIRAAAPLPATVAPAPPAAPSQPVEGFEAYRSVRQYSAWFRG